jgi:hypothetical protein
VSTVTFDTSCCHVKRIFQLPRFIIAVEISRIKQQNDIETNTRINTYDPRYRCESFADPMSIIQKLEESNQVNDDMEPNGSIEICINPEISSADTTTMTFVSSNTTSSTSSRSVEQDSTQPSLQDVMRKTGVAVAGGTMVVVGLIMIPLPTPFGCVVAGSGMAVLGTEFPVAERILDETCNKVADAIEYSSRDDPDDDVDLSMCSNEKMRKILNERKAKRDPMKHNLKQIGKKVAPVIRKIGEGIDKEQLERTAETISKAATEAKNVFQTKSSEFWGLFRDSSQWEYSKVPGSPTVS